VEPLRISPTHLERPKVDTKLLQHGTSVTVPAIISKTGHITDIKFVKGNADLMPEVRRVLKSWRYKPYIYHGQPVEVESDILGNFDPLTGG